MKFRKFFPLSFLFFSACSAPLNSPEQSLKSPSPSQFNPAQVAPPNTGSFELAGCWELEQASSQETLIRFRFESDEESLYKGAYGGGTLGEGFSNPYTFDVTHDDKKIVITKKGRIELGGIFLDFLKGDIINSDLISLSFFEQNIAGSENGHFKRISCENIPPLKSVAQTDTEAFIPTEHIISGKVEGQITNQTKIAFFGAFANVTGAKIDLDNKIIDADRTFLATSIESGTGQFSFAFPRPPQKAFIGRFEIFAFDDLNGNDHFDPEEPKSKEAVLTWARTSEGNISTILSPEGTAFYAFPVHLTFTL